MSIRRHPALGLLAALALAGCVGPVGEVEALELASIELFAEEIEPDLELRCASGGCHGNAERPLSLYAPGAYRADPAATYLDEPLTAWEVRQNARRVSAFAHGDSAWSSLVIQKPLARSAGGVWHGGGEIYAETEDLACRALVRWLELRAPIDEETP